MAKIIVLDAETLGFDREEWEAIEAQGELVWFDSTDHADNALIQKRCAEADIVLTNKVPLREEVIRNSPNLRLIATLATGYNQIDIDAADAAGVTVCNAVGYSTPATAQHAVALMLELCNRVGLHDASVQAGDWASSKHFCYWLAPLTELQGLTVGIVGLGEIGRQVGRILDAFDVKILGSMRTPRNPPEYQSFRFATTEEIFAEADIVSLHCPLTADNEKFVNRELLATMKKSAFLINTARGALVDETDLADALREKVIAGAALDVVSSEPMKADNPLRGAPNLIITPHIAWATASARRRLLSAVHENIAAFLDGNPQNVVNGNR